MRSEIIENKLVIYGEGRITSDNVEKISNEFFGICGANGHESLEFNLNGLEYISSAGLRMLLKVKKNENSFKLTEVSNEIYDILETTGFSSILDVERALKEVSVDGCTIIGEGFYSQVYRLDPEKIIKVYVRDTTIDVIRCELDLAKQAFLKGVPTAISYDVVKVGDKYGVVFELLSKGNLKKAILEDRDNIDYYIDLYTDLIRKINSTRIGDFELPSIRERYLEKVEIIKEFISKEDYDKLCLLLGQLPEEETYCHGDCHIKNIMFGDGELMLIDMETLSKGSVLFEFAGMYTAYCGYSLFDHGNIMDFFGVEYELVQTIFYGVLEKYFGAVSEDVFPRNCDRIALMGLLDMVKRMLVLEHNEEKMSKYYAELQKVLCRVDTLELEMGNEE